jgi:hypothetical protein
MHYLVQRNVFIDENYDRLAETLEELKLPYEIIDLIPASDELHFATSRRDVFVYGSVKLAKNARRYDWKPGSFYGGNHDFEIYAKAYGEHLLNHDSYIAAFGDALDWKPGELKFIRPTRDAKVFTGREFTRMKWEDFVSVTLEDNNPRVQAGMPVQITSPKKLFKEARVWIVGGKPVTSSYYRFHGTTGYEEHVAPEGLDFAQQMASLYCVAEAFVMDICATPDGWKIVEINCVNSAGFYKADVRKLVLALEKIVA